MKLGVMTVLYQSLSLPQALDKLVGLGVEAVELGTGNYPGNHHCDPEHLLADRARVKDLKSSIGDRGLTISALSQHGNPLHPDETVARAAHETWRRTAELAELLDVHVVNAFSGCPGDHDGARYPS